MEKDVISRIEFGERRPDKSAGILISEGLVTGVVIGGHEVQFDSDLSTPQEFNLDNLTVRVRDFSTHPMNLELRFGDMTDPALIQEEAPKILLSAQSDEGKFGLVLPRVVDEGSLAAHVASDKDSDEPFRITMYEFIDGEFQPIEPKIPGDRILHATQILGHIKDACDMQMFAHEQNTLSNWEFAFPPTKRRSVNQHGLVNNGVPTHEVTRNWSYSPETEELPTDFSQPESFDTVLGFLAANLELCRDVTDGSFGVVSTNFKQEGNLLKALNPEVLLSGINFTFLEGTPGERVPQHANNPKFQRMLARVQESLDKSPHVLRDLVGRDVAPADWWRITREKMQRVDYLFYRTFSHNADIPSSVDSSEVVQIPHPIPEIRLTKSESREYLGTIIGKELTEEERVIILAGESSDSSFDKRLKGVIEFVQNNPHVNVIIPIARDDKRFKDISIPENVFPVGFREDWMDIIPSGDVTFIRGSWGEILDVIPAGNIPIFSSPGEVPSSGDVGLIQFLTEVSGERAVNLSLFMKELELQGVSPAVLEGLTCDIADDNLEGEIENALTVALDRDVQAQVLNAFNRIKKDGIPWMVKLHEQLVKEKGLNREEAERVIWSR